MKTKRQSTRRRGFTLVELLVVIVIIAALAGLSAPMILRQRKAADRTEAVNNAKQIGMALIEFDVEYSSYPDNYTAEQVADSTGSNLNLSGDSSNDYLRQLIAFGIENEEIFYARTAYTREPDNDVTTGNALDEGEVGFGYVMLEGNVAQSSAGHSGRPVLAAPLLDAKEDWTFDPNPYADQAVILRNDNSVQTRRIRETDNMVTTGGGRRLQDTGQDTVWGATTTPELVAPAVRGGN